MQNIQIYTKEGCHYCLLAKKFLDTHELAYEEIVVGADITVNDLLKEFPEAKTVPLIVIDHNNIGGYSELQNLLFTKEQNNNE